MQLNVVHGLGVKGSQHSTNMTNTEFSEKFLRIEMMYVQRDFF